MQRSEQPRSWTSGLGNRRAALGLAAVVVIGSMIGVTQVSNAATRRSQRANAAACKTAVDTKRDLGTVNNGTVRNYKDDNGRAPVKAAAPAANAAPAAQANANQANANQNSANWAKNNQNGRNQRAAGQASQAAPAGQAAAGQAAAGQAGTKGNNGKGNNGKGNNGNGAAASAPAKASQPAAVCASGKAAANPKIVNGLQILGDTCADSKLPPHTGFQAGNQCSNTEFGEVPAVANGPSLLITQAPTTVKVGQAFTLEVSTRNLVRDRFLGAAAGGYYLESSFLTAEGLVRGHFHTACRMLTSENAAPDPAPAPAFFVATEDGKGGKNPDTVKIQVTGMPQKGIAQCASWAGDGSHRIPMMELAKQTPAFDAVRIKVQ